jgi:hypothetical protein
LQAVADECFGERICNARRENGVAAIVADGDQMRIARRGNREPLLEGGHRHRVAKLARRLVLQTDFLQEAGIAAELQVLDHVRSGGTAAQQVCLGAQHLVAFVAAGIWSDFLRTDDPRHLRLDLYGGLCGVDRLDQLDADSTQSERGDDDRKHQQPVAPDHRPECMNIDPAAARREIVIVAIARHHRAVVDPDDSQTVVLRG